MAAPLVSLAHLCERELLDHFEDLVARDRRTTVDLLVAIAEIDERRLWARQACSSMFAFCMKRFHMSEQTTAKRLWAARTARRYPEILPMVARGELHLSAIGRLAGHLTADNHLELLERARHKSSREIEALVAELAPRPDRPSRIRALPGLRVADSTAEKSADHEDGASPPKGQLPWTPRAGSAGKPIIAVGPRRYRIEITVDEETHDKLRSLQDLLGRSATGRDPAAILSRAIDALLARTLARKAGLTDRPRPRGNSGDSAGRQRDRGDSGTGDRRPRSTGDSGTGGSRPRSSGNSCNGDSRQPSPGDSCNGGGRPRSRGIPAAVRREVWQRDCGRCRYVDDRGRRCEGTSNVEFHHKVAFARGGSHRPDNLELRCAAHNQYQADLDFGPAFMAGKRGHSASAGTFPGECSVSVGVALSPTRP